MDIEEFIGMVKKRPLMFIEVEKVDYLYYLILGYLGSNLTNKLGYTVDRQFKSHFLKWVKRWVVKNINPNYKNICFYWHIIIRELVNNEEEAVSLFFKLSEQFFSEYHLGKDFASECEEEYDKYDKDEGDE